MYQKIYLTLIICLCFFVGNTQIVSTESFNAVTFPPTGWSIKVNIAPNNVWVRQTNGTNPTVTPHSGAGLARYRSRSVAAGTKQILITRPIDYTNRGANAANLDFWMFRDSLLPANLDSLTVWVNSTDTIDATAVKLGTIVRNRSVAMPDTQAVNGWYHYIYAIPATFTGTTTRFIFEGTSETPVAGQGANIFIDDISFDEFPLTCSGTPNVGNILNTNPIICGGGGAANLALTAPIIGMPGISYTWQTAASAAGPWTNIGTNSPTLNISSVVATAYYQCVANCSFSSLNYTTNVDSIIVSTNPLPTVIVSPASATYCAGSAGTELVASSAITYAWSPAASLNVSNNDSVLATPTASTQYTVTGTDSVGCANTATVNVTFSNLPATNITAAPNDTVCLGEQVVLTSVATGGLGNTYIWSNGITTRRDTIIVTSDTTLWVNVTNTAGCSLADTITITAIPPAVADFTYTSSVNTYTFNDNSSPATSWTWTFGDGNGSNIQSPVYTFSGPGTYTVTLIISGTGCNDDTTEQVIVVLPQSIDENSLLSQLTYHPNPVKDVLHVAVSQFFIDQVIVRNQVGQEIFKYANDKQSTSLNIPVHNLAAGIYFAEVFIEGKKVPLKFVKE